MASDFTGPQDIGAASAPQDDLDLLRRRLANVLGHALRTPAATVRGQAEILAVLSEPEARDDALALLQRAARRLEEMIDDLLLVQQIDTRLPTAAPGPLDVEEAVRRAADGLDVVESVVFTGDRDAQVLAGSDGLHWILRSVLDNAGRYGRGPVLVDVSRKDLVSVRVSTREGGVGATDDDLRLAFEPFYRGERAVMVTATRLGLGLTVARRLATDLGGDIRLEREADDGIVAVLELPRA